MQTVIELSYWNIHCYTIMYVAFIIFWFLLILRFFNRNDDASVSFFSYLTSYQKKDIMKKQLQLVSDKYESERMEYINRKIKEQMERMYNDLASAISLRPEIQSKIRAFRDQYKI